MNTEPAKLNVKALWIAENKRESNKNGQNLPAGHRQNKLFQLSQVLPIVMNTRNFKASTVSTIVAKKMLFTAFRNYPFTFENYEQTDYFGGEHVAGTKA